MMNSDIAGAKAWPIIRSRKLGKFKRDPNHDPLMLPKGYENENNKIIYDSMYYNDIL